MSYGVPPLYSTSVFNKNVFEDVNKKRSSATYIADGSVNDAEFKTLDGIVGSFGTGAVGSIRAGLDARVIDNSTATRGTYCNGAEIDIMGTVGNGSSMYMGTYARKFSTDNICFGNRVFFVRTTGNKNVAIGTDTGIACTGGSANTMLGTQAGEALVTGNENTYLGFRSGSALTTCSSSTAIGARALCTAGNQIMLGGCLPGQPYAQVVVPGDLYAQGRLANVTYVNTSGSYTYTWAQLAEYYYAFAGSITINFPTIAGSSPDKNGRMVWVIPDYTANSVTVNGAIRQTGASPLDLTTVVITLPTRFVAVNNKWIMH